jgi:hypothetical protein
VERELTAPVDIAHPDGRLRAEAIGWARHPVQRCNLERGVSRAAKWNYWCISSREAALTILVADVGLVGGVLLSFQDFAARRPVERLYARPGGLRDDLPDNPRGDVVVSARRIHLAMCAEDDDLHVEIDARTVFGTRIEADLVIERSPLHETVNVLVPWDETHFQFTSKQQALPARGTVRIDGAEHHFRPDNQGFACLDFGRGRWPSRIHWNWAFASHADARHTIGLNLGGRWTDGTGVTENGIVIDGRLHKIHEPVDFTYDRRDFMRPWHIRSRGDHRVDIAFTPLRERTFRLPLGIKSVSLHQCIGTFSGTFLDDTGRSLTLSDMLGQAEEVLARL